MNEIDVPGLQNRVVLCIVHYQPFAKGRFLYKIEKLEKVIDKLHQIAYTMVSKGSFEKPSPNKFV